MTKVGGAYIEIRADNSKLSEDLDGAHNKVTSSTTKMQNSVTTAFKIMAAAAAAAIGYAVAKSVSEFAEFEVALNRLGNVSDRSIKSMRDDILSLSSELGSVTDLTKGYYQVMSAGITDTDESMAMLTVSAKMSKEATVAQGDAVKGLVAVMGAYSDELKTATDAADLLYTIERSGITSVGELIPLIGNLANLSKSAGISSDEMAAALAQITTTGAGTAISVTQLQSLLTGLSKDFTKLPPEVTKYGSALEAVKALGFQGVLKEIMRYTEGNSTAIGKMLGRQEAYLALLQLSKNEFNDYGSRLGGMTDKVGAFDSAWERYSVTLTAVWDTFKNTIGKQAVLLGEELTPKIKEVVLEMSKWIEQNPEAIKQVSELTVNTLNLAVAIGKVIGYIAKLTNEEVTFFQAIGLASAGVISWKTALLDSSGAVEKFNTDLGRLGLQSEKLKQEIEDLRKITEQPMFFASDKDELAKKITALKEVEKQINALKETQVTATETVIAAENKELKTVIDNEKEKTAAVKDGVTYKTEAATKAAEATIKAAEDLRDKEIKPAEDAAAVAKQLASDRATAARDMYSDIDDSSRDYFAAEQVLIDKQRDAYYELYKDDTAAHELAAEDKAAIDAWHADQVEKNNDKMLLSNGTVVDGFKLGLKDMLNETKSWAERSKEYMEDVKDSFESSTDDIVENWIAGESLKVSVTEAAESLMSDIAVSTATTMKNAVIDQVVGAIGVWLGSGTASSSTQGDTVAEKLAWGAAYLAGTVGLMALARSTASSGWATGGWIENHPMGGMIRQGSGYKDDVYLGQTPGINHWGMGGEYVINQKSTNKYYDLIKAINEDNLCNGGPCGKKYAEGGMLEGTDWRDLADKLQSSGWGVFAKGFSEGGIYQGLKDAILYYSGVVLASYGAKKWGDDLLFAQGGQVGNKNIGYGFFSDIVEDIKDAAEDPNTWLDPSGAGWDFASEQLSKETGYDINLQGPAGELGNNIYSIVDWVMDILGPLDAMQYILGDCYTRLTNPKSIWEDIKGSLATTIKPFVVSLLTPGDYSAYESGAWDDWGQGWKDYYKGSWKDCIGGKDGGVFSGPESGYPVVLHGTEEVTPIKKSGNKKDMVINIGSLVTVEGTLIADENTFNGFVNKINDRLYKLQQWGY